MVASSSRRVHSPRVGVDRDNLARGHIFSSISPVTPSFNRQQRYVSNSSVSPLGLNPARPSALPVPIFTNTRFGSTTATAETALEVTTAPTQIISSLLTTISDKFEGFYTTINSLLSSRTRRNKHREGRVIKPQHARIQSSVGRPSSLSLISPVSYGSVRRRSRLGRAASAAERTDSDMVMMDMKGMSQPSYTLQDTIMDHQDQPQQPCRSSMEDSERIRILEEKLALLEQQLKLRAGESVAHSCDSDMLVEAELKNVSTVPPPPPPPPPQSHPFIPIRAPCTSTSTITSPESTFKATLAQSIAAVKLRPISTHAKKSSPTTTINISLPRGRTDVTLYPRTPQGTMKLMLDEMKGVQLKQLLPSQSPCKRSVGEHIDKSNDTRDPNQVNRIISDHQHLQNALKKKFRMMYTALRDDVEESKTGASENVVNSDLGNECFGTDHDVNTALEYRGISTNENDTELERGCTSSVWEWS
ncbi:hypothetical protein BATDEDRAFT_87861 [Batrachochytrium dendrobatidis JAM81]|uniref:Uncharacterized protein n=1 Tax=Batrachochytrium dendrobatidis (strain JAM81 / FGSC 10211) TaxID=684364 RepID=F4NZR8_BATDJ|nr:uncharacterized protein BATDEDRAFT_87861 [Batrachochytrium dendrobatidis JAM81]EGF81233.1 hypothetical protein BATDEDRAFT_87861 [Batrachochytrium dendrobatidis JAM81]|eukprot:XP_006678131.1 hypothetical protein BATDEDRAFT_87861 [Batrachochytrium dendrobatidis JAM81]